MSGKQDARRSSPKLNMSPRLNVTLTGAIALLVSALALDIAAQEPPRNLEPPPGIAAVHTLKQNWTDDEARKFYNVPQGSHLVPFSWFIFLEQVGTQAPFRAAQHMRALGYLPRTPEAPGNPYGLPIGFVKDGEYIGLTCAACHTNQINYQGKAWLVDGAPTLGDAEKLQRELVAALDATIADVDKFNRFAANVLGNRASDAAAIAGLKDELRRVADGRRAYNQRNLPRAGAPAFGPGRVDAFGAILNEVAVTFAQVPGNDAPADAPVSYPFLWDTPQHDRVQWNGAAENKTSILFKLIAGTSHVGALGRNIGEVLGVFGTVDAAREGGLVQRHGYPGSANKQNLIAIEESLRKLWSPQWPQAISGINESLRGPGEVLFRQRCSSCHADIQRDDPDRAITAVMAATGTDPKMAQNFATRQSKSGPLLTGRSFAPIGFRKLKVVEPTRDLLTHLVQRLVVFPTEQQPFGGAVTTPGELLAALQSGPRYAVFAEVKTANRRILGAFEHIEFAGDRIQLMVSRDPLRLSEAGKLFHQDRSAMDNVQRFIADDGASIELNASDAVRQDATNAGTRLTFEQPAGVEYCYKARPLNGIWATAPYLHNGSVPNLDELLKPAAQRAQKFRVGSREFDAERVGFRTDVGDFEFDTALPGNSSAGHEYSLALTDLERKQLIEYMKSL